MTDPSFAAFYPSMQYTCNNWTSVRGFRISPCPAGTAFTQTVAAGQAIMENTDFGQLTCASKVPPLHKGARKLVWAQRDELEC